MERRLSGAGNDTGDTTGIPGLVLDIKDREQSRPGVWIDQLLEEMATAEVDHGAVIWRRRGIPDVGQWHALLPVSVLADLLRAAGYGEPHAGPK